MELFWKSICAALIAAILSLILERQGKDYAIILSASAAGMIAITAFHFLEPTLTFLKQLETFADINVDMLLCLLKILGVGMTGELAASVCNDAGNSALGKGILLLEKAAVFYISLPVYSSLINLVRGLLEGK